MGKILIIVALGFLAVPCHAQQTFIQATITDPNGAVYQFLTGQASINCPGNQAPLYTGYSVPRNFPIVGGDGNGHFTLILYDVNLLTPRGCSYNFSITAQNGVTTFIAPAIGAAGSATPITGAGPVNLSAAISAYAVLLPTGGGSSGVCASTPGSLQYSKSGIFACAQGMTTPNGTDLFLAGQDPWRDVKAYGAAGSNATGTLASAFNSGTTTISMTAAGDFRNGEGIRLASGAGNLSSVTPPTGLAVVPCSDVQSSLAPTCPGSTGATTYQYQVIAVDVNWGPSAATTAVAITNGNASLTLANYNRVTWNAVSGATYYCVYGRTSGAMTLQGCTPLLGWYDYGRASGLSSVVTEPSTIPSSPPGAAGVGFYYGKILAGGGTATLTMDTAAGGTLAGGNTVEHDDSAAFQAAWNTSATGAGNNGDRIMMPCGQYLITQTVIFSPTGVNNPSGNEWYGESQDCVKLYQHVAKDIFYVPNANVRIFFHDFTIANANNSSGADFDLSNGVSGNNGNGGLNSFRIERVTTNGGGVGIKVNANIVILNMRQLSMGNDEAFQLGEPGNPIQLDSINCLECETYVNANVLNWPAFNMIVGGSVGSIRFTRGLQEGQFGNIGYTGPEYMIGGFTGDILFDQVEFAPESAWSTGAYFQAVPGLGGCCQRLMFANIAEGLPDNGGGVIDWSAATGNRPYTIIFNSIYGGVHNVFKNASDTVNGLFCYNSTIGNQTTLSLVGGANHTVINCRGFNNSNSNFQVLAAISDQQSANPLIDIRDQSAAPGLPIFQVTQQGAIWSYDKAFARLTACSGTIAGQFATVSDSTTNVWGATITGGGANVVLGFCDGTNWTVFAK